MMFGSLILLMCIVKSGLGQFRPASHCEIQRQGPSPEWAKPKCNPDGSYKIYQCDAYTRTTCWCVYENGQMIPGTARKVHDPEQEKRDLAKCEKARKTAPAAPPPAPAPSATLDPRLGYHLATAQIPNPAMQQLPNMASAPAPPQEITIPIVLQDCPQYCTNNCPPGCPVRLSQQIAIDPMPPMLMPQMSTPQINPCPLPCQGVACPPGCPQTPPTMPVQMLPQMVPMQMPTQPSAQQCPPLCMNSCPPGCPPIMQQQQLTALYQPTPPQIPMMPVQTPAMMSQQACPNPCVNQCPPGCPQSFMDPSTGRIVQGMPTMMQQSYGVQPNQMQQNQPSQPRLQQLTKNSKVKLRPSKYKNPRSNNAFIMKMIRNKGRLNQALPKRVQGMMIRRAQKNQRNFWKDW